MKSINKKIILFAGFGKLMLSAILFAPNPSTSKPKGTRAVAFTLPKPRSKVALTKAQEPEKKTLQQSSLPRQIDHRPNSSEIDPSKTNRSILPEKIKALLSNPIARKKVRSKIKTEKEFKALFLGAILYLKRMNNEEKNEFGEWIKEEDILQNYINSEPKIKEILTINGINLPKQGLWGLFKSKISKYAGFIQLIGGMGLVAYQFKNIFNDISTPASLKMIKPQYQILANDLVKIDISSTSAESNNTDYCSKKLEEILKVRNRAGFRLEEINIDSSIKPKAGHVDNNLTIVGSLIKKITANLGASDLSQNIEKLKEYCSEDDRAKINKALKELEIVIPLEEKEKGYLEQAGDKVSQMIQSSHNCATAAFRFVIRKNKPDLEQRRKELKQLLLEIFRRTILNSLSR